MPNVEFLVEDAEDEWLGAPYDYIHMCMLAGSIKDWPGLLAKAFNHLTPGGWIEIVEFEVQLYSHNDRIDQAPDILTWQKGLNKAANQIGRSMDVVVHLKNWVQAASFTDVVEEKKIVPVGPWPKDKDMKILGAYHLLNMLDAASSYGQAHFTRVLGWSAEEYAVLNAKVRSQMKDRNLQLYSNLYVFSQPLWVL
jgi:hypothetical protein